MVLAVDWLVLLAWFGVVSALLVGLHLIATWMENRGWIYYRKGSGRGYGAAMSNAIAELESILDPAAEHRVVEERRQDRARPVADDTEPGAEGAD